MKVHTKEEFWSMVDKGSSCWLWTGMKFQRSGYAAVKFRGKLTGAHRVAWILSNGEVPMGLCVCHKCDVRDCVRPDHLFLGTHLDNARDRVAKGRNSNRVGTKNPAAKLREDDVLDIRAALAFGATQRAVARAYGVTQGCVADIATRTNWSHLP